MTDVEVSRDESRKRKIDSLLTILDKSKFIPSAPVNQSTFAPWDRSALCARLSTFRAYPIHASRSRINAYTLSRRGWTCLDSTTIACLSCHARVAIHTSPNPDAMATLEGKIEDRVVHGHAPKCPWSTRGCHETLLRIPLADREMSLDAFARRVHSFEDAGEDEQKVLRHTGRGVEVPDDFRGLDTVALLGWSFSKQGTLALLVCQDCHRRLRLPANGSLDAWEEHYDYCPWVSTKTQGAESGWSVLLKHWKKANAPDVVAQAHDGQVVVPLEDKDSREQVRQVRQKLGFV